MWSLLLPPYISPAPFSHLAVDQVQLDRAKQSTKSAILMNLESRVSKPFLFPYNEDP